MVVMVAVLMAIPGLGIHPETQPLLRGYFWCLMPHTPFLLLYARSGAICRPRATSGR